MVRRVANISCVMVGWPMGISPLVFVADSVLLASMSIHLLSNVVINVCNCMCMHVPAMPLWVHAV